MAEKYRVPIVVTGFEPVDILLGIYRAIQCWKRGGSGLKMLIKIGQRGREQGSPPTPQGNFCSCGQEMEGYWEISQWEDLRFRTTIR